ncbi:MAG: Formamidopyrimidine-DNA glycosylase [uncultured Thermomicrobiales bacterium]|uniref:Formamidopyrimidine-DNA glycosylase n=1 Tax=uncultured Thermomicrobiales bacterium TaxID=1645740 RepID=A0A6J4V771_9BACT|nr:MAG: Formamidopyrimidine-DNA glycosylase [uncultured Thermomicrobiales bacterium]
MPELPEVETVRRGLEEQLAGRSFAAQPLVRLEWPRTIAAPTPEALAARLGGRGIRGVRRRAKFLIVDLDGGEHLVIHLRMTGQLRVVPATAPPDRFERVAFALAGGDELRFSDIRRFGRVALLDEAELVERLRALGPEPLGDEWGAEAFAAGLARRRSRLKPLLLDQSFLAGLGNIYVDEALHRAGLHPLILADEVPAARAVALHAAVREVLAEAIASGGTSFSNYRDAYGGEGDYYERRRVYGRADQPCLTCGDAIRRIVVGGRGTHFCPSCQGEPERGGQTAEGRRGTRADDGEGPLPLVSRRRPPLRRVAEEGEPYDEAGQS